MNENREGPVNANTGSRHTGPQPGTDMTQRVRLDGSPVPRQGSAPGAPVRKKKSSRRRRQQRNILIIAVAAVLLLAVLVGLLIHFLKSPEDNGLILNNVYAAGVNLGGKTPEQAKAAITAATRDTYSKLDMVVTVHDTRVELAPQDTNARLDVDALVEAAYNYGRTGTRAEREKAKNQAANSSYHLSILPYLRLDTDYIKSVVDSLGEKYSSTLSQPSFEIRGTRPDLNVGTKDVDCDTVHQTILLHVGTPEYGLSTEQLYNQIMEAYNINIFQVSAQITVVTPDTMDIDDIFNRNCISPVDAELDTQTYEVTPEVYGYGFSLSGAKEALQNAKYGDTITLDMTFLRPNFTAEELAGDLFTDTLATSITPMPEDKAAQVNLILAVRELNGIILKSEQEFSFNARLGRPTESQGYKSAEVFVGKKLESILGGGISQLSSAIYYCALRADMEITDREAHYYAPEFIAPGLDADILFGSKDLCFKNTSHRPIRIDMEITDSAQLVVSIVGTKNEEQAVDVVYETIKTYEPLTLVTVLAQGTEGAYNDGDVLVKGITGCDVNTYRVYTDPSKPYAKPVKKLVASTHYDKRNEVVVAIQEPTEPPTEPPTEAPTETPTEAPTTAPTEPIETSVPTNDPSQSRPGGNAE